MMHNCGWKGTTDAMTVDCLWKKCWHL